VHAVNVDLTTTTTEHSFQEFVATIEPNKQAIELQTTLETIAEDCCEMALYPSKEEKSKRMQIYIYDIVIYDFVFIQ